MLSTGITQTLYGMIHERVRKSIRPVEGRELGIIDLDSAQFFLTDIKAKEAVLREAITALERRLNQHTYLCGDEKTIADLSAACELDQGCMFGLDIKKLIWKYPKTAQWLKHMIMDDEINSAIAARLRKGATMMRTWLG